MDKSEYELERDRNMAENAQHLAALGIEPLFGTGAAQYHGVAPFQM